MAPNLPNLRRALGLLAGRCAFLRGHTLKLSVESFLSKRRNLEKVFFSNSCFFKNRRKAQASELENQDQTLTRKCGLFSYLLGCIFIHRACWLIFMDSLMCSFLSSHCLLFICPLHSLETCREKGTHAFDGFSK